MRVIGVFGAQIAVALVIIGAGLAMVAGADVMTRAFDNLGVGATVRVSLGAVEAVAGLCLLLPRSAMAGAALLISLSVSVSAAVVANAAHQTLVASIPSHLAAPRLEQAVERDCIIGGRRDDVPLPGHNI